MSKPIIQSMVGRRATFQNLAHYPNLHRKECVIVDDWRGDQDHHSHQFGVVFTAESKPMAVYDHEISILPADPVSAEITIKRPTINEVLDVLEQLYELTPCQGQFGNVAHMSAMRKARTIILKSGRSLKEEDEE